MLGRILRGGLTLALGLGLLSTAACGGGGSASNTTTPTTPPTTTPQTPVNASAGPDQQVATSSLVALDATGSDPDAQSWTWTQTSGPAVTLSGGNSPRPSFRTPVIPGTLEFEVKVVDSTGRETTDTVQVVVDAAVDVLQHLGSFAVSGGDEGRAEIPAYHAPTRRVFVTNADDERVDVYDISNPAAPFFVSSLLPPGAGPWGGPNSVSVHGDWVAVATENTNKQAAGFVFFFNALTLDFTTLVSAGALPDMLMWTPDGTKVLVACEGEPDDDYLVDPDGSITIIDVDLSTPNVLAITGVRTASLTGFNGSEAALRAENIRIFGPGASASQDLEPEYIAYDANTDRAFVACQENNCVAVVDCATATVVDLVPLGWKDWGGADLPRSVKVALCTFPTLPELGTAGGQTIRLGGFSGLWFDGMDPTTGAYRFVTVPDRGPQLGTTNADADPEAERPFVLPDYQARLVHFSVDPTTCAVTITGETMLTQADGTTPITGRPNLLGTSTKLAFYDEEPVDLLGNVLALDPLGGDFEGVLRAPDGTWWLCDEYRPAIYHFASSGALMDRYVPAGSNAFGATVGTETLPPVYAQRRANRGFEAIALDETTGRLYAWIQSPIDNPDTPDDANSKASRILRIVEIDPTTGATTGEFVQVLDCGASVDKIGDAVWTGTPGEFQVIVRNSTTGAGAIKNVIKVTLAGATNLQSLAAGEYAAIAGPGGVLEGTDPADLGTLSTPIVPVKATLYANLADAGYTAYDKPEGLALLPDGSLAVLNDNDFGIAGASVDFSTGQLTLDPAAGTEIALALIEVLPLGLDTSDRDGGIHILPHPELRGIFQPDALASFTCDGRTYFVTANEGDARDYDGFTEEFRVKDSEVVLDPTAFPTGATLKDDANLGRLRISLIGEENPGTPGDGDTDLDGDQDVLVTYGARSISVWDDQGRLVWDGGDQMERLVAAVAPDLFNMNGEPADFDERSDDKGPEPEGVVVGEIDGVPYAFVGLERTNAIVVYDLRHAGSPRLVQMCPAPAGDSSPEGMVFIPASDSPTGKSLLVVAYEVSGTIAIFEVGL